MRSIILIGYLIMFTFWLAGQGVAINTTGDTAHIRAMLDISSSDKGFLLPRMSAAQRDLMTDLPEGLQIYNTTSKTIDIYQGMEWLSLAFEDTSSAKGNIVFVTTLADFPTPSAGVITLNGEYVYKISGLVDIGTNYINMNGAAIVGTFPEKDAILGSVTGAILRSTNANVYMENVAVIIAGANTSALDFADTTGTKFCNIFQGCSFIDAMPGMGIGQISGFSAVTILKNYWSSGKGIKITGTMGKLAMNLNFITGITTGSAVELLPGLTALDIDMTSNYFVYEGNTGLHVNNANVTTGRLTNNLFRGVTTPLQGITSFTNGWEMLSNADAIPNTRAYGYLSINDNSTTTTFASQGVFTKILGTNNAGGSSSKRYSIANNRLTYTGTKTVPARAIAIISAQAPGNNTSFSITITKNGSVVSGSPFSSLPALNTNQGFQITLESEVSVSPGDFFEVWVRSNTGTLSLTVSEVQFRIVNF